MVGGHHGKGPCSIPFFVKQMCTEACSMPASVQSKVGNGDRWTGLSLPLGTLINRTGKMEGL